MVTMVNYVMCASFLTTNKKIKTRPESKIFRLTKDIFSTFNKL